MVEAELVAGPGVGGELLRRYVPLQREVVVRREGRERVVPRYDVVSFGGYLARRNRFHPDPNSSLGDQVFVKLFHGVFRPTLVPYLEETDRRRGQQRRSGRRVARRSAEPQQGDLNLGLDEPVQTLLNPVDKGGENAHNGAAKDNVKELPPVEEVLVINVVAREGDGFKGPALLQNILESGLRFGEMDIFHRHESMAGNGEVLFSMANALKPGTFDGTCVFVTGGGTGLGKAIVPSVAGETEAKAETKCESKSESKGESCATKTPEKAAAG